MKRKVKIKAGQTGFTLLETAVAAMVIGVGIMSIMNLFILATLNNQSSKQATIANNLARRRMEFLLATSPTSTALAYGGTLSNGNTNLTAGYNEFYYVDHDRLVNGVLVKGTGEVKVQTTNPVFNGFYTGQQPTYVVSWQIQPDNVLVGGNPELPGLKRISVRAEALNAALVGNGASTANGGPKKESTTLSTIRTPSL